MNSTSKHLPAEQRRAVTVETGVELAAEQNPNSITTSAIAKRMGVTQGALFRHFPSKNAILKAVMEWVAARLMSRILKAMEAEESPLAALEAMFIAHIGFVAEYPGIPRILFGELQHAKSTPVKTVVQKLIGAYQGKIIKVTEKGKACGEIDGQLDAVFVATVFIGAIQGLVMQTLLSGDIKGMKANAPEVFAILKRGIRG
ncbi:MAG: TetR/AcrR family transcriptional regulator [Planctomycetes bacterium]|nr:TetR/AcrR family transcriptional regulator [Planctomycetota bacterium]